MTAQAVERPYLFILEQIFLDDLEICKELAMFIAPVLLEILGAHILLTIEKDCQAHTIMPSMQLSWLVDRWNVRHGTVSIDVILE